MSLNFHRRHLKPHEKGAALAAYMERVGAKKQQGKRTDRTSPESGEVEPKTITAVAKKFGIPRQTASEYLKAAEDYKAAAPQLKAKVDAGSSTVAADCGSARPRWWVRRSA